MDPFLSLLIGLSIIAFLTGTTSIARALGSIAEQIRLLRVGVERELQKHADKGAEMPRQRMGESDEDYNRRLFRFQTTGRNDV